MSITASTIEWAEELVETPEEDAPELDDLPDCFQWRDTLRQVTTTLRDASVLGMPAPHGALFFGPPGNGRHTLAQAYISTMWRWRQVGPELVPLFRVDASQFPEGLDLQEALDRIDTIFDVISDPGKYDFCDDAEFGIILFDQMERYAHVDALAYSIAQWTADLSDHAAVICITEDESIIPSDLRRALLPCRCSNPGPRLRQQILKWGLRWKTPAEHRQVDLGLEGITVDDLVQRTDGLNCAGLHDLVMMLRLEALTDVLTTDKPYVHVSLKEDAVLNALELQERRAAPAAAAPAVIQTVAVPAAAAPQTQTTAANLQKDPAEMTWEEYLKHRTTNQN